MRSSWPVLVTAILLSVPLVSADAGAPLLPAQPPNFVVILVDDLRWDELSCTGHPVLRTPHIDRIAYEGARFRNAFVSTSLCSPSRACFLTGTYAQRHGILDNTNRSELSHRLHTFPKMLQKNGYETAYVGKWHMGNDDSPRPGFDFWSALQGQGTSFDPWLNENGRRRQYRGHTTDVLNERAMSFVCQQHTKPFCLYLAHKALHPEVVQYDDGSLSDPGGERFLPAPRHTTLYRDAPIPRRLNVTDTLADKTALARKLPGLPPLGPGTGTANETVRDRWRMLAAIDEGVGQLFSALEETRRLDDTVVVFTSDNGYWYGEHGLGVERRLAYEEGIRIPLLLRYPPLIRRGLLVDEMALSIDLAPTVLELAGVTPSPDQLDGHSLIPLLRGEHPKDWRTAFLIEYYSDNVFPRISHMGYRAVRTERHKYIHYVELEGMDEFYDLSADPYEMKNLIAEPAAQEQLRRTQAELSRLTSQGR